MSTLAQLGARYRMVLLALVVSVAAHAAVFLGMPKRIAALEQGPQAYDATLDTPVADFSTAATVAVPKPLPTVRAHRARPQKLAAAPQLTSASDVLAALPVAREPAPQPVDLTRALTTPEPEPEPPEMLALAQPNAPLNSVEPDAFPVAALPASLSIAYQITSAFADGQAVYNWEREGDSYRITGEAAAEGFFALFLEGRIQQESRGKVTATGLQPDRFTERRPNNVREGLEFDWPARQVTLVRGDQTKSAPLAENTVDWLSMIFQLAHVPPKGETMALQVYTQRRMYRYRLAVVGEETIEIPLGKVRALHLRHIDEKDATEVVDVWLGIDQHNLPVKLRFPVAKNRLMVEQVATRVTER
jgi:hypothetical protein